MISLRSFVSLTSKTRSVGQASLPLFPEPQAGEKIMLIAAHPDDEWLSSAGFFQRAIKNGAEIKIVIVTLGEWSSAYSYLDDGKLQNFFASLGAKRAKETLAAFKLFDPNEPGIVFLGYPGGHLHSFLKKNWTRALLVHYLKTNKVIFPFAEAPGAEFSGTRLFEILKELMLDYKPDRVITHAPFDVHKDHKTIFWLVRDGLQQLKYRPHFFSFLIHYRGFSFSGKNALGRRLAVPKRFLQDNGSWYSFELNKEEKKNKKRGVLKYKTQLKNPYLNILMKSFCRENELFHREEYGPGGVYPK